MSFGDVLLGGGITLAGTVMTQLVAWKLSDRQQRAQQAQAAAKYERDALDRLQTAATEYRSACFRYNTDLRRTGQTSDDRERELKEARAAYQAVVYLASPEVSQRLDQWATIAEQWAMNEGNAKTEEAAWTSAMQLCGREQRKTINQ